MASFKASEGQEIHDWSQYCTALFHKLESTLADRGDIHRHTIYDYSQRFNLWVGSIGVFADGRESLDQRLRFNRNLRDVIVSMLRLVGGNLSHESWFQSASKEPTIHEVALGAASETSTLSAANEALDIIRDTIDSLCRLAAHIRESPSPIVDPRPQSFAHRDPTGVEEFKKMASLFILGRLPDIEVSLASQLVSSISIRRFRFLIEGHHNEKKYDTRRSRVNAAPLQPEDKTTIQQWLASSEGDSSTSKHLQTEAMPAGPLQQRAYSTTKHSGFNSEKSQHHDSGSSDVPNASTVTSVVQGYSYPPRPKLGKDDKYYACDWCPDEIQVSDLDVPGWWRAHLKKDLQPYVCISEQCAKPPVYFSSFAKWREHMRGAHTPEWPRTIHTPKVWYCGITPHEYLRFENKKELEKHLRREHVELSAWQLERRLTRNTLPSWREKHICLICNQDISKIYERKPSIPGRYITSPATAVEREPRLAKLSTKVRLQDVEDSFSDSSIDEETHGYIVDDIQLSLTAEKRNKFDSMKVARHIARHLKSLAFMSIRYLEGDAKVEEGESLKVAPSADGNESENPRPADEIAERILRDFPEAINGKLDFEDIPLAEKIETREGEHPETFAQIDKEAATPSKREVRSGNALNEQDLHAPKDPPEDELFKNVGAGDERLTRYSDTRLQFVPEGPREANSQQRKQKRNMFDAKLKQLQAAARLREQDREQDDSSRFREIWDLKLLPNISQVLDDNNVEGGYSIDVTRSSDPRSHIIVTITAILATTNVERQIKKTKSEMLSDDLDSTTTIVFRRGGVKFSTDSGESLGRVSTRSSEDSCISPRNAGWSANPAIGDSVGWKGETASLGPLLQIDNAFYRLVCWHLFDDHGENRRCINVQPPQGLSTFHPSLADSGGHLGTFMGDVVAYSGLMYETTRRSVCIRQDHGARVLMDWALVESPEVSQRRVNIVRRPVPGGRSVHEGGDNVEIEITKTQDPESFRLACEDSQLPPLVYSVGRTSGYTTGQLGITYGHQKLPNGNKTKNWVVHDVAPDIEATMGEWVRAGMGLPGDSGAGVFGFWNNELLGQIWAHNVYEESNTEPRIVFFTAMDDIYADIADRMPGITTADIQLPTEQSIRDSVSLEHRPKTATHDPTFKGVGQHLHNPIRKVLDITDCEDDKALDSLPIRTKQTGEGSNQKNYEEVLH
ncbi:hypothetical protein GGR51DRAFT_561784 [Nemania sp. FL0031]|nr:hypothetical protein GGR51DRAFT_561784 [Nemania sp. FL0031]